MKTLHVTSLGCPKNFVDSEVMIGILEQGGWTLVDDPERADCFLVNTCGFIQPAVEEAIAEILECAEYAEKNGAKLVVAGCLVQRYREKLLEELPEIDLLLGTEAVGDIARLLAEMMSGKRQGTAVIPGPALMDSTLPRRLATPPFRAWMKVTEGCDNRCSYCLIPSLRGDLRSRSVDDLVLEAKRLDAGGVRELTLIAQDLTAFGRDRGSPELVPLLRRLLAETAIDWLRLLYLYPSEISDELLSLMAQSPRIVPYLDIPMQHVSDTVLARMNRRYGREDLTALLGRIRQTNPGIALRTTFLVGFPGETEDDIVQLEKFLTEMRLDHVGIFAYANEEGAASERFAGQVAEEEKQRRREHLLAVQQNISAEIQKKYIGRVEPVLVEGVSRETELLLEGRTRYQAPEIDGCVYINDGRANAGDIVEVRISEAQIYDLVGAIV